jgi:hypothetical protein
MGQLDGAMGWRSKTGASASAQSVIEFLVLTLSVRTKFTASEARIDGAETYRRYR